MIVLLGHSQVWAALSMVATAMFCLLATSVGLVWSALASTRLHRIRSSGVAGRPMRQVTEFCTQPVPSNIGLLAPLRVHAGALVMSPMLAMISGAACTKMSNSLVAPAVVRNEGSRR